MGAPGGCGEAPVGCVGGTGSRGGPPGEEAPGKALKKGNPARDGGGLPLRAA